MTETEGLTVALKLALEQLANGKLLSVKTLLRGLLAEFGEPTQAVDDAVLRVVGKKNNNQ